MSKKIVWISVLQEVPFVSLEEVLRRIKGVVSVIELERQEVGDEVADLLHSQELNKHRLDSKSESEAFTIIKRNAINEAIVELISWLERSRM
ncbi:MAG: hypothetical protein ACYTEQ_12390 [Planctomycetota bacterium]|jgi:hypothetical protein